MSTILLIDGENFKAKLADVFKETKKDRPQWDTYNFKGLISKVLANQNIDRRVFYFAKIKEHPSTIKKSKQLIEEQRLLKNHLQRQGFEVILSGRVRGQLEDGFLGKKILVFKEKGVDVKIAVDMVSLACDKKVKEIILGSSDSDLQPAINEVKSRLVKCIYLGFEVGFNRGLAYNTGNTILIRNSEVLEFDKLKQRVSAVIIKDGKILLIRRIKLGEEYYTFPGGSVEDRETLEQAMRREVKEELSLDAEIEKPIFKIEGKEKIDSYFQIKQYKGNIELGGPELKRMRQDNQYIIEWMELSKVFSMENIYPKEAVAEVLNFLKIRK